MKTNDTPLLQLKNLTTVFPTKRGLVTAVNQVNLRVAPGEILGIVGESGCGKSTVLLSILRLIARPGRIAAGEIIFRGQNLRRLPKKAMRSIRGKEISMIFQDPLSTLNPVFPVGEQIREALRLHGLMNRGSAALPWPLDGARRALEKKRVLEVMAEVGIPAPEARYRAYPHEFSGGMQQRALIAIGLACEPAILLADEPTTALDVTIQAQIIELMRRINQLHGTSILLVTHNLGLAAEFCHNIAVMYAGRIVERGPVDQVIQDPKHPYTQGLLACLPRLTSKVKKIEPIPGNVPDLAELPPGCAFAPRCPLVRDECWQADLRLRVVTPGHYARCILYEGGERYTPEENSASSLENGEMRVAEISQLPSHPDRSGSR
ncbi:MAG: ABC transporter ATP-binding protein [Anaerolineales bacterium]|nr:ABC transporter ATP-binding protein [Anaerolineales bacterium]